LKFCVRGGGVYSILELLIWGDLQIEKKKKKKKDKKTSLIIRCNGLLQCSTLKLQCEDADFKACELLHIHEYRWLRIKWAVAYS
jgi:hypothetical protein